MLPCLRDEPLEQSDGSSNCLLHLIVTTLMVLVMGCGESDVLPPPPSEIAGDEIGYYCQMLVSNHQGPKGQIFLKGKTKPLWFSSVRDTINFTLLPGEPKSILAIYVNDMTDNNWQQPSSGSWISAYEAWYVIDSDATGGMGQPEIVPFSTLGAANKFVGNRGGRAIPFDAVAEKDVR